MKNLKRIDPVQADRRRRESARVLRVIASPKVIAGATGVHVRQVQMWCAGDRDQPLGALADLLQALVSEGVSVWRAVAYIQADIRRAEMDVRDVAPETDHQAALQELHDQAARVQSQLFAAIQGGADHDSIKTLALDVAEAGQTLYAATVRLQDHERKERRRKIGLAS